MSQQAFDFLNDQMKGISVLRREYTRITNLLVEVKNNSKKKDRKTRDLCNLELIQIGLDVSRFGLLVKEFNSGNDILIRKVEMDLMFRNLYPVITNKKRKLGDVK